MSQPPLSALSHLQRVTSFLTGFNSFNQQVDSQPVSGIFKLTCELRPLPDCLAWPAFLTALDFLPVAVQRLSPVQKALELPFWVWLTFGCESHYSWYCNLAMTDPALSSSPSNQLAGKVEQTLASVTEQLFWWPGSTTDSPVPADVHESRMEGQ